MKGNSRIFEKPQHKKRKKNEDKDKTKPNTEDDDVDVQINECEIGNSPVFQPKTLKKNKVK